MRKGKRRNVYKLNKRHYNNSNYLFKSIGEGLIKQKTWEGRWMRVNWNTLKIYVSKGFSIIVWTNCVSKETNLMK